LRRRASAEREGRTERGERAQRSERVSPVDQLVPVLDRVAPAAALASSAASFLVAPSRAALLGAGLFARPAAAVVQPATRSRTAAEPELSFDELMFRMDDASSREEAWATEMSGRGGTHDTDPDASPRRSGARIAFLILVAIVVPLAAGMIIYLGLLWTTPAISAPPGWLPKQLWLPPWPVAAAK
jgi:hypothetical protein